VEPAVMQAVSELQHLQQND
jgi:hypothetical protein